MRGELLLTTIYVVEVYYDKYHLNSTDQKKKIFCMTEKCDETYLFLLFENVAQFASLLVELNRSTLHSSDSW